MELASGAISKTTGWSVTNVIGTPSFTIERYLNRPDWLRARKRSLGSSDAAPVVGMGRFRGAYSVATDKLTEGIDDKPADETAEWGTRHEPTITQKFREVMEANREPMDVVDPGDFTIYRSVERPWLTCTPDRLIFNLGELTAELSLKCAWYDQAKEWNKAIPLGYQIQAQHTMYVLGIDQVYFAVLLNGCSFRWHTMRRNERWLGRMLPRLDSFWESIGRGEYPNVDESTATAEALARRYANPNAGRIELPDDYETLGQEYDKLLAHDRENEKRKVAIQNQIKDKLGNNSVGVLPDMSGFSWNVNSNGSRRFLRVEKVHVDG